MSNHFPFQACLSSAQINTWQAFLQGKNKPLIVQAENPDGDSMASALALEEALPGAKLYCPVETPKYLRYFEGWSRICTDFPDDIDSIIIVDTAAAALLTKLLDDPLIASKLRTLPVLIIDHHETASTLDFAFSALILPLSSCAALVFELLLATKATISKQMAENLLYGLLSDTLGLTTPTTTADDFRRAGALVDLGADVAAMEDRRRELSKKSARILDYKADLIKRVEYHLDGHLATVHIPFEDIQTFSDEYNPNVLILEELRTVIDVDVAVAIKTYPDGKLTGKIRSTKPIAEKLAGYFGGGGHPYAAGFKVYEDYETVLKDLVSATDNLLML